MTPAEQKIVDLSVKVIATQDTEAFRSAIRELKNALHAHVSDTRDKVADLALAIANINESKQLKATD